MTAENLEDDKVLMMNEFKGSLVLFSNNALSVQRAKSIAESTLDGIDINHPTLAHKGINWLAKEILKTIKI